MGAEYNPSAIEGCDPDDPNRCQAVTAKGQCMRKGAQLPMGGFASYCRIHGGISAQRNETKAEYRGVLLGQWQARMEELKSDPELKSLRSEIGILRMLLEVQFQQCLTPIDLITNSYKISELVTKVERLVTSCHKIDNSLGNLLDKGDVIQLATEIIQIICTHVEDQDKVKAISDDISALLSRVGQPTEEN